MKIAILFLSLIAIFTFFGCQTHTESNAQYSTAESTETTKIDIAPESDTIKYPEFDVSPNDAQCPIAIISTSAKVDEYGHGVISIKYKNVSDRSIDAAEFSYKKFNAFNEPLGNRSYNEFSKEWTINNYGKGEILKIVPAGKTVTGYIKTHNEDKSLKKITAETDKAAFQDGDVWRSTATLILDAERKGT